MCDSFAITRDIAGTASRFWCAVYLFFSMVPPLYADNIYLKSDYVLVNVRCRMVVDGDLLADGTDRLHRIPFDFIAMIDTLPIDGDAETRMIDRGIFEWSVVTRTQVLAAGQPVPGQISITTADGRMIFGHYAGTRDTAISIATAGGIVSLSPSQIIDADRIALAGCDSATIEGQCPEGVLSRYHQQRLRLDLGGSTWHLFSASYPYVVPTMYDHWSQWNASCANQPLSEEEFFRSAGLSSEAAAAKSYHKTTTTLRLAGGVAVVCGVLLYLADSGRKKFPAENTDNASSLSPLTIGATMLAVGGSATLVLGLIRERNMFPYSKARTIADEYNRRLIISIQKTL